MHSLALLTGFALITVVLLDAFQSIILPRRPVGRFRITRLFFISTWQPWKLAAGAVGSKSTREQFFSIYGPLSLLLLFFLWALLLTTGFGAVFFGLHLAFKDPMVANPTHWSRLRSCLYFSGTTLFTLGLGDVLPQSQLARLLTICEGGTGLGFVALVIGYVPVLYQAFSHREILVALLDARAGSPPSATELLVRHNFEGGPEVMRSLLADWERWCAEMLETHISYPILCYYRSQHDNQSWLAALTTMLDTCALLITMLDGRETRQAQLTFAIGRHVLVDLVHVFRQEATERQLRDAPLTRLPAGEMKMLCAALQSMGLATRIEVEDQERLIALRKLYEPSACTLAAYLRIELPHWNPATRKPGGQHDAWTVVQGLRSPRATAEKLTGEISTQATAMHLATQEAGTDSLN